jgi:hypothetical protein
VTPENLAACEAKHDHIERASRLCSSVVHPMVKEAGGTSTFHVFDHGCSAVAHIGLSGRFTRILITGDWIEGVFVPLDLLDLPDPEPVLRSFVQGVIFALINDPEAYPETGR